MRRISIALILLIGFFAFGCERKPLPPSPAELTLGGEHKLRKMTERTEADSRISASFFLIFGNVSGSTTTRALVKFAWEMNDGTYAISSLPLEKIRIRFDENSINPTIRFRWVRYGSKDTPEPQKLMDYYVVYALVTVRENEWPIQVKMPLNSQ
jgi:hypothetical protein